MIKHIDFITQFSKVYTYETHKTKVFSKAFAQLGISSSIVCMEEGRFGKYMQKVGKQPPSCTLSFVDPFPGEAPLCEILNIPHYCMPEQGISEVFSYLRTPQGHVGVTDRYTYQTLHQNNYSNAFFLAPGVELEEKWYAESEKEYEVVLFEDLNDIECLRNTWKELFAPDHVEILEKAVFLCEKDKMLPPAKALFLVLNQKKVSSEKVFFSDLLFSIEEYLKALRTQEMIEALKGVRIDVFGEHVGNNWLRRLKNAQNVFLHWSLPYSEYFEVLKRSKILIRHQLKANDCADEWVFAALSVGCLPLTNASPFFEECFENDLPFYSSFEQMNELVQQFLPASLRWKCLSHLKNVILPDHSWLKRAETFLSYIRKHEN